MQEKKMTHTLSIQKSKNDPPPSPMIKDGVSQLKKIRSSLALPPTRGIRVIMVKNLCLGRLKTSP
jgi:hypothetical protein